jgi:hypothetical protein
MKDIPIEEEEVEELMNRGEVNGQHFGTRNWNELSSIEMKKADLGIEKSSYIKSHSVGE